MKGGNSLVETAIANIQCRENVLMACGVANSATDGAGAAANDVEFQKTDSIDDVIFGHPFSPLFLSTAAERSQGRLSNLESYVCVCLCDCKDNKR